MLEEVNQMIETPQIKKAEAIFKKILPNFLIFSAIAILLSLWSGFLWLNSIVIILFSLAATYLMQKKFSLSFDRPLLVCALAALAFIMASYSLFFITPYYTASTDPAYLITIRSIGDTVPDTYEPYSPLKFRYQFGHALFVKLFTDILPIIPDHIIQWLIGAIFVSIETVAIYIFASTFFSRRAALLSTALFLGTRPVFLAMYWGAHPMIMGMAFALLALALFHKRNPLSYLFAPLPFILHPASAINMLILLAAYLTTHLERIRDAFKHLPSLLLALPIFLTTYLVLFTNFLLPLETTAKAAVGLATIIESFYYLVLWAGLVPVGALLFAIAATIILKKKILNFLSVENKFISLALALSTLLFFVATSLQIPITAKLASVVAIATVLLAASFLASLAKNFTKKHEIIIISLIALISLALFLNSSLLTELRTGTQITPEEASFAFKFKELDPELKPTLFLTPGRLKMAEFSNKIPYNALGECFLPSGSFQAVHDAGWDDIHARNETYLELCGCEPVLAVSMNRTGELCVSCIPKLGVEYVVINTKYFPEPLPWPVVLEEGELRLHSLSDQPSST